MTNYRRWTQEEDDLMFSLYRKGIQGAVDAITALNIKRGFVPRTLLSVKSRAQTLGIATINAHYKLSEHDKWLINELIREGLTRKEVAEKFEVSVDYVKRNTKSQEANI